VDEVQIHVIKGKKSYLLEGQINEDKSLPTKSKQKKSCGELQGCSQKPKARNWNSLDMNRDIQNRREIQTYKQRTGKTTEP
jgi:hypothetical protein